MGTLWPDPPPVRRVLCEHCRTHWVRTDRLVAGRYGKACARDLGLTAPTVRVQQDPQTGTDLLDHLPKEECDDEPDDCCDGWDR